MAAPSGVWAVTTLALMGASFIGGIVLTPHLSTRESAAPTPRLGIDAPTRGELTSASPVNLKDGSRYQHFRLDLAGEGIVSVSLDAPFAGTLTVIDDVQKLQAQASSEPGADAGATVAFRALADGSYTLVVSGHDHRAYGPFTLSAQQVALDQDAPLTVPGEVRGWLQGRTATHALEVAETARYSLALSSDSFDTLLELDGNGISRSDDDGGGGTNSLIDTVLAPGSYTLRVQAFGGDEANGLYTLSASSQPAPDLTQMTNDGPLVLDEAVTGWLEAGTPNTYTLEVVSAGEYTLDLRSDDFDTVLEIEGRGLSLEDDDGGDGTNSSLSQRLAAGSYEVRVRSFGNDSPGTYTLTARRNR